MSEDREKVLLVKSDGRVQNTTITVDGVELPVTEFRIALDADTMQLTVSLRLEPEICVIDLKTRQWLIENIEELREEFFKSI